VTDTAWGRRHSGAGNGSAKYSVSRSILSPRNYMIVTTLTGSPPS
jgi:hypothetical protein